MRKQFGLHKYPGREADDRVSSEDEEYDDEADAGWMTGAVQWLLRISETTKKRVRCGLGEIAKLNAEMSAIRGRIHDPSG